MRSVNNHLVAATAAGTSLADGVSLKLNGQRLKPVLTEFQRLPAVERTPDITPSGGRADRPLPQPPEDGMIIRGYCTYLERDGSEKLQRQEVYYYKQNPDRWKSETQSDTMWLRKNEWKNLIPDSLSLGDTFTIDEKIQQRFFSTLAIDYMEGSASSLPVRSSTMTVTVSKIDATGTTLTLAGAGHMGTDFETHDRSVERSRGCKISVTGYLHRQADGNFDRFDIVGVGEAWGNKNQFYRSNMNLESYPWQYGIACELVESNRPVDLVPPYNLLHYDESGAAYFAD